MFLSFFLPKKKKLIGQWTKEHKEILELAQKVREEYKKNKFYSSKQRLKELRTLTLEHLMSEDNELHKIIQESEEPDLELEELVNEFNESFQETKPTLIHFLKEYANDDAVLDDEFLKKLNKLIVAFTKRVVYEEKTLYSQLGS
ncbi:MAG: hypothetical protein U9Q40_01705 [Campylobacterota bacterium]|nr:hypothetical protein [Campylobacterota bacterium]